MRLDPTLLGDREDSLHCSDSGADNWSFQLQGGIELSLPGSSYPRDTMDCPAHSIFLEKDLAVVLNTSFL